MLKFIDTHAHLTDEKLKDLNEIRKHWEDENISNVFAVAYNLQSSIDSVELANTNSDIYAIVGIHPDELQDYTDESLNILKQLANNDKVIAIGEIGLDYHYIKSDDIETKNKQKELFVAQMILADELNLPIMIHVRDAIGDLISILKQNKHLINNGGVIHCFSESIESYNIIKDLGLAIGVGGVVTFKNGKKLQDVVTKCNIQDIILETDCPYLAPEPYRGTMNEPKYIYTIAEKICEIRNISMKDLSDITNENIKRIFPKFKG